jgi:hypothetical protein
MRATLLWMFVVNLGIAFGAGLYEHRIVVPLWLSSSENGATHWHADVVRRDDTGRRFWALVTTMPLTLLTLANLFVASARQRTFGSGGWPRVWPRSPIVC